MPRVSPQKVAQGATRRDRKSIIGWSWTGVIDVIHHTPLARMRVMDSVQRAIRRPRRIRSSRTNAPLMRIVSAARRWLMVQPTMSPR